MEPTARAARLGTRRQFDLCHAGITGPVLTAVAVALIAFLLYDATLLPGQGLGDTASFQETVADPALTPRDAYPLYYALGRVFVRLLPDNPARALNLESAVGGAVACGLLTWTVIALTGWFSAGAFAGLLLAASYTFWSQAVIAEVYTLHLALAGACLAAAIGWAAKPTGTRLALFFGLYALGFGNHLSMVLLLPGFVVLLLWAAPGGPWSMLHPRVVLLALAMAILGASQYAWNLSTLWNLPDRAPGLGNLLADFWFDVTKADWRASMVLGVAPRTGVSRLAGYWFDLRQQFGWPAVLLAAGGVAWLLRKRPALGVSLLVLFAVNWAFAFTYNVGDRYVFYLPSHYLFALAAGCGVAVAGLLIGRLVPRSFSLRRARQPGAGPVLASLLVLYPAWRAVDTLPALDRSGDEQARRFFDSLTTGLTGRTAILGSDLNWQLQNGLDYYTQQTNPDVVTFTTADTLLYLPFVVRDNWAIDRDVALTAESAARIEAAYDGLFVIDPDPRVSGTTLFGRVRDLPAGSVYVLTMLAPYPDLPLDEADVGETMTWLTGGTLPMPGRRLFNVVAGRVGAGPDLVRSADRPFRVTVTVGRLNLDIRMEAWLPADTIRRMGFGHVVANRRHALMIDRGVSLVAFDADGRFIRQAYASALLAPQPRFIMRRAATR